MVNKEELLKVCAVPKSCPHQVQEISGDYYADDEWRSDGAYCMFCGMDFGWYCPVAPNHICCYDNGDSDSCDYCGMPSERK